eukprot:8353409-Lingulodinium_polyedra.AAC.1
MDVAWPARRNARPGASREEFARDFWVDVPQGVERRPWGSLRTICQNTVWYSYERKPCFVGACESAHDGHAP